MASWYEKGQDKFRERRQARTFGAGTETGKPTAPYLPSGVPVRAAAADPPARPAPKHPFATSETIREAA